MAVSANNNQQFVNWFRNSSPYINAFRGRTFVIAFDGEVIIDQQFPHLVHDIALLNSLGVKLILVHGARPQIEQRLRERKAKIHYVNGMRVTDDAALDCVKEAVGSVRVEIEALLSMGLANSPMAGARIRVASGNFVTARPLGVRDGVDYQHTGEVRRIDQHAIQQRLDDNAIVLLSPIGYSVTGEAFNLSALEVASACAIAVNADKLITLIDGRGLTDGRKRLIRQLSLSDADAMLSGKRKLHPGVKEHLKRAVYACRNGVRRIHLIDRTIDGALLLELFTRDGVGSMITTDIYEGTRRATIEDLGGILELISPLEQEGILVRRSREHLEMEIDYYTVIERDGMIIACAALYPFPDEGVAELACLAVHPDYQKTGYGTAFVEHMESQASIQGLKRLFILTTRATHWFRERGFKAKDIKTLPIKRQALYNYQRKSKLFVKDL